MCSGGGLGLRWCGVSLTLCLGLPAEVCQGHRLSCLFGGKCLTLSTGRPLSASHGRLEPQSTLCVLAQFYRPFVRGAQAVFCDYRVVAADSHRQERMVCMTACSAHYCLRPSSATAFTHSKIAWGSAGACALGGLQPACLLRFHQFRRNVEVTSLLLCQRGGRVLYVHAMLGVAFVRRKPIERIYNVFGFCLFIFFVDARLLLLSRRFLGC